MVISNLDLYELLVEKVGKPEAKAITQYIEVEVDKKVDEKIPVLATKQDLTEKIADLEVRLTQKIFISGVVQFLATVGSVLAIVAFVMKK